MLLADSYPNFSICGLPYFLSGDVPDWRSLAHRTTDELELAGVEVLSEHTAERIDADTRTVTMRRSEAGERHLRYDKLIVATGAEPIRPSLPGIDNESVFQLHRVGDSLVLHDALERKLESAVIVGAGYIGLEMAEALRTRGLAVTVVEQLSTVLPTVDPQLGAQVRDELERRGVRVLNNVTVTAIQERNGRLAVIDDDGLDVDAGMALVVVGVRPNTRLGRTAGIDTGPRGALRVNRRMETNLPHIYAAGGCVVTHHRLLESDTYLPLGTTAHKQGRVAGENAVGGAREFHGSLGTQVVKVFELAIARTGLRDSEARAAGLEPLTVESRSYDHKVYYPAAHEGTRHR